MTQIEITIWEQENMNKIVGWEVCYAYKNEKKEWVWYDGYAMIIFEMRDKTKIEFKREK